MTLIPTGPTIITLDSGLNISNFSSPHEFVFDTGEVLPACTNTWAEKTKLDIGYLHRGVEKIAENKTYQEFMPYTDRMDYLSPYSNNVALCTAVEKIANVEVPDRAHYIRMIGCELARISSHLLSLSGPSASVKRSTILWIKLLVTGLQFHIPELVVLLMI